MRFNHTLRIAPSCRAFYSLQVPGLQLAWEARMPCKRVENNNVNIWETDDITLEQGTELDGSSLVMISDKSTIHGYLTIKVVYKLVSLGAKRVTYYYYKWGRHRAMSESH
jgi:hypothetical protein